MNTLGILRCLLRSRVLAWSWLIVNRCQTNKIIRVLLVSLILWAAKSVSRIMLLRHEQNCLEGLDVQISWTGRRLRFWHPGLAATILQVGGSASWSNQSKKAMSVLHVSVLEHNAQVFQRQELLAPSLVEKIKRIKPPCDFGW